VVSGVYGLIKWRRNCNKLLDIALQNQKTRVPLRLKYQNTNSPLLGGVGGGKKYAKHITTRFVRLYIADS
jgi:hypothetical protein